MNRLVPESHLVPRLSPVSAEPIIVEVTFRNPLKVPLALSKLSLLWRFAPVGASPSEEKIAEEPAAETITNEETLAVEVGNLSKL